MTQVDLFLKSQNANFFIHCQLTILSHTLFSQDLSLKNMQCYHVRTVGSL